MSTLDRVSVLSRQILSLQADEVQKENQVEEYERELARARWRLRKLREEVKQAKRKMEEAGERNTPLQDSIRQSYEEILQVRQVVHVHKYMGVFACVGTNKTFTEGCTVNRNLIKIAI